MDPTSNGITGAIQKFFEQHAGDVYAADGVLLAILVIAVIAMVCNGNGCKKGSHDDTVTRY
jgi:hypothetical protein